MDDMKDDHNSSEILNEKDNISDKFNLRIDEEGIVEDLQLKLINTIETSSNLIKNIIQTLESTVTDEKVKKESQEIFNKVNVELKSLLTETKNKFSDIFIIATNNEEE